MLAVLSSLSRFKAFRQTNVNVSVDEKVRIDVQLAIGNVTEVVEVRASEIALQTDSSDLSRAVSQQGSPLYRTSVEAHFGLRRSYLVSLHGRTSTT
jgi:hypothetical protein